LYGKDSLSHFTFWLSLSESLSPKLSWTLV